MRRDAIGPCNNVSRPANRAWALGIVDVLRSILETDSLSASADGVTEPAGAGATSPYSPSGIVDSFMGSGIEKWREPCSVVSGGTPAIRYRAGAPICSARLRQAPFESLKRFG